MGKDLEGSGGGLIEVLSQRVSRETEGIHKKSVRIRFVPTDIRTEHFRIRLKHTVEHLLSNQLGNGPILFTQK
jgi:hypothetical protein